MKMGLAALAAICLCGCVDRVMTIRSEPPGAEVFLDGEPIGRTPSDGAGLDIPYFWYGTREVVVTQRGYMSHRELVELNAPWWQVFPFDFITDVLLPIRLKDKTTVEVKLLPDTTDRSIVAQVLDRANTARARIEMETLKEAILAYWKDNAEYPRTLQALITKPEPGTEEAKVVRWKRAILNGPALPLDPWRNDFVYAPPGDAKKGDFDLHSKGPDGKDGTADDVR